MNNRKDETGDSTSQNRDSDATSRKGRRDEQETTLGDLEPRAEIKGGSLPGVYSVPDVTLKRGSGG